MRRVSKGLLAMAVCCGALLGVMGTGEASICIHNHTTLTSVGVTYGHKVNHPVIDYTTYKLPYQKGVYMYLHQAGGNSLEIDAGQLKNGDMVQVTGVWDAMKEHIIHKGCH